MVDSRSRGSDLAPWIFKKEDKMITVFIILIIAVICLFTFAILKDGSRRDKHQDKMMREEWLKRHRRKG